MTTKMHAQAIQLIQARTGLAVGTLLRAVIAPYLAQVEDLPAWTQELAASPLHAPIWQDLLAALTIGETYFMRDPLHFQLLRERILPEHMAHTAARTLRVLCVGCATGEEAYSLAITLREALPDFATWRLELLAVDLNERALETARRATYRHWSLRQSDASFVARYFHRNANDTYTLAQPIRQMVQFTQANLLELTTDTPFDLIFCRHVLLYCDKAAIAQAERKLYELLRPQGWLVLGQAETLRATREAWTMVIYPAAPLYQRPKQPDKTSIRYARLAQPPPKDFAQPKPDEEAYAQIVTALRQEGAAHAETLLMDLLARFPHDVRGHTLLGFAFANRRAYPEAESQLRLALQYAPLYADAHYVRAMMLHEQGKTSRMAQALQATLYCDRNHLLGLLLYGQHWQTRDEMNKARHFWARAYAVAQSQPAHAFVSDYSEITHGELAALLRGYLDED